MSGQSALGEKIELSVVIPVFNEEASLPALFAALEGVAPKLPRGYEVVFVNDGSTDGSAVVIREHIATRPHYRMVSFCRNFGQTAALAAGIDHSKGPIIVALDADMQNDPEDIPQLVAKLDDGYDVVSGWRKNRHDAAITRLLPSIIANRVIGFVSGVHLHDYGCTLKAYRRRVLEPYALYGEMHRFIPIYAQWAGARVTEMVVRHHPRVAGSSKYGLSRMYKVVLDLVTVSFLGSYSTKPVYFFGKPALVLFGFGVFGTALFITQYAKVHVFHRPGNWLEGSTILILTVFVFLVGVQLILMGLLAELLMRTYFEARGRKSYLVREVVGFPEGATETDAARS